MPKLVDVSHQITDGMTTCPGLPEPVIKESTTVAGAVPGHGDSSGRVSMVGATGTYVEIPAHSYRDAADPADLDLDRVACLRGIVVDATGHRQIGPEVFSGLDLRGRAVLLRTGWDRHWRTETYGTHEHPHLTETAAKTLVQAGVTLVGIDSIGVDDTSPATEGPVPPRPPCSPRVCRSSATCACSIDSPPRASPSTRFPPRCARWRPSRSGPSPSSTRTEPRRARRPRYRSASTSRWARRRSRRALRSAS